MEFHLPSIVQVVERRTVDCDRTSLVAGSNAARRIFLSPIGFLHMIMYPYQVFAWVNYKQTLHNLLREVALGVSSAMKVLHVS